MNSSSEVMIYPSILIPADVLQNPKGSETGRLNDWALGYDKDKHNMTCMLKHTRAVYASQKYPESHITRKENAGRLISPSSKSIIISNHTKQNKEL